ncbi:hypothetical protein BCR44DRAFT_64299 [Catenaria anguillulae PL171]|uniref:NAD(P)-binding protein n=1 Tax=Catenaria anguillulae PL171 TaxID=765915 RepID=A0A1Y2HAA9_9FUNG|nr:hypothetical protein BCR44DRAFT_64299 [Catenaria anguillulae PL171]
MGRLAGQTVFITGASSGIGASQFAAENSNLILTARRADRLDALRSELLAAHPSIKVHTAALDVTKRDHVFEVVRSLPEDLQAVDVLVNNAGLVIGLDHLVDVKPEHVDTMFETNVKGLLHVTQAILPGMKERNKGHVINVGSIAGKQAYQGGSIYCATKHAVEAMTRALTQELIPTNIRVTLVTPGLVETEFSVVRFQGDKNKADGVYKGLEPLTGDDIAEIIVFTASRPPHVQIRICRGDMCVVTHHRFGVFACAVNDVVVFPSAQSSAWHVHRE